MTTVQACGAHRFATRPTSGVPHARCVRIRCAMLARVTCRDNSCSVFTSVVAHVAVHFRIRPDLCDRQKAIPETASSSELETTPRGSGNDHTAQDAPAWPVAHEAPPCGGGAGRLPARATIDLARSAASAPRTAVRSAAAEESGHQDRREFGVPSPASSRNRIGSRRGHGHYSREAAMSERVTRGRESVSGTPRGRECDSPSERRIVLHCGSSAVRAFEGMAGTTVAATRIHHGP